MTKSLWKTLERQSCLCVSIATIDDRVLVTVGGQNCVLVLGIDGALHRKYSGTSDNVSCCLTMRHPVTKGQVTVFATFNGRVNVL